MQHTIKNELEISGVGLHTGVTTTLRMKPAAADFGIVFKRVDLPSQPEIKAIYSNVVDTRNSTCLGDDKGNIVSTIEHLMAVLAICKIDNLLIEIDNIEMPILDGSGAVFLSHFENAEKVEQSAKRKHIKILKEVKFEDDKGNWTSLSPADEFSVKFDIEFPSKIVGHQIFDDKITTENFKELIAPCRTFCEKYQIDYLKSIGLIKGGSLDNAVVLDGETILNEGGFRLPNECVNHKVLDAIGDLYTAGLQIMGYQSAYHSGHYHNNELLKVLFSDSLNYEII